MPLECNRKYLFGMLSVGVVSHIDFFSSGAQDDLGNLPDYF